MSGERPFPASARRLAEARRAGRVPWSPALVAGGAIAGGAIATAALGAAWAREVGRGIVEGARAGGAADPVATAGAIDASDVIERVLALAAPVVLVVAAIAAAAHVAQTRGLWIPRRTARRLPAPLDDAGRRAGTDGLGLARGAAVAAVAGSVVVSAAAVLARHAGAPVAATGALAASLAGLVLAHAAAAAIALGVIDWLERLRRHRADLAMSARDVRDERRESEADPRWRHAARTAGADDEAVRRALVVVVGDDVAAALAWHPRWQPVPMVTTLARGRAALGIAALARRHRVPLVRDPLAGQLAPGVVPERLHAAVARIVVAVERRGLDQSARAS